MSIDDLYKLAEEKGHEIVRYDLPQSGSVSVCIDGKCAIGIDPHLSGADELEHVAHEMGHCETGTFYTQDTDESTKARWEYKARKWAFEHIVPPEEILNAFRDGTRDSWELAERFGLNEETVLTILRHYGLL